MDTVVPALLAVSPCAQERTLLRDLFADSRWNVSWVYTFREALRIVRKKHVGVLLSGTEFSDGHCWRDMLRELQRLPSPPMLIVTDRLADERLWAEVLNLGGYDLLMKPLNAEEVFRVARSAWAAWDRGRAHTGNRAA